MNRYILIGADFVPTVDNEEFFRRGDCSAVMDDKLINIIKNAEHSIFNLELPLVDSDSPIRKCGPNLRASTSAIALYKKLGSIILSLANNHILDHGKKGLESTIAVLSKEGIPYLGAGKNLHHSSAPYQLEFAGKKLCVYACAEHEFSIASEKTWGANPFDPYDSPRQIKNIKEKCDYLIVLYHGGKEHYRYPSPCLQKNCRSLVENGADLVICQHSHCIGCKENYLGGTIIYGQGNFLFNYDHNEYWETGLLIQLNDDFCLDYIPLVQNGYGVMHADANKTNDILKSFIDRSNKILDGDFIEQSYLNFANGALFEYLFCFSGMRRTIIGRVINKLSSGKYYNLRIKKRYNPDMLSAIMNYVECEAHRELLIRGLKNKM